MQKNKSDKNQLIKCIVFDTVKPRIEAPGISVQVALTPGLYAGPGY